MAAAVPGQGPCCLDLDLDALDEETGLGGARMNRLNNFKLRIRRGNTGDAATRRGPVVARHQVMAHIGVTEQANEVARQTGPSPHRCRTPPPIPVNGMGEGSHQRKTSPSIPRSRPSSPGNGSARRPPSPGTLDPALMESVRNRVRRVQQARLYLLQQTGPNSFLVGGDSPDHKYRVVIGPQTCSCGRGPHCLHLLFVMLRVFQVPESDSRIYAKELKNYEVESLFRNYQERRNSRVNMTPDDMQKDMVHVCGSGSHIIIESDSSSRCTTDSSTASHVKPGEEELCPICLLEMVDGESLVICITGCRNKLHHHCMSIWAQECYQQTESVLCPLCRHPWISEGDSTRPHLDDVEMKHRVGTHIEAALPAQKPCGLMKKQQPKTLNKRSPSASSSFGCKSTSHTQESSYIVIPPEQMVVANEWMKVFGTDLVSCLYSRTWKVREMALRRLMNDVIASQHSDSEEERQQFLWCCARILTMVAADPVFEVYLGCVRCLRVLLSYASCHTKHQQEELQDLICPIIRTLLLKCTDRDLRTSCLSAEVLLELAKGKNGELALGRNVANNRSCLDLEGLELVLDCILEDWTFETVSWQWLAGRLIILDHLIQDFPDEFWLQYVPLYPNESGYKLHNYNRLITVVEFAFKALRSPHSMVAKLARQVFVISSSLTAKERGVFNNVLEMLSGLDPNLQIRLKKRLQQAATECGTQVQNQAPAPGVKKPKAARCGGNERCNSQRESQSVRASLADSSYQSPVLKSLLSPTMVKTSKLQDINSSTSPPRPRDLPLDLSKVTNKKPVKFQQLPGISPMQISSCKRWGSSRLKLLNLFLNKKPDELLPTKPELNGIYRDLGSPVGQGSENPQITYCSHQKEQRLSSCAGLWSKITTPTTPTAPHSTPVLDIGGMHNPDDECEVVLIPLDFSECDIPSIPGLNSPLETDIPAFHPQEQNMEDVMKCNSYLEGVDWKRGQLLGTGAFSICYQARDLATGTLMAVKQVRFSRNNKEEQSITESGICEEIVTMSKLRHDNIVRILGATKQGKHFNMFVEWMAGGSVASLLDKYGPFNEEVIVRYIKQVLEGLSYLHENQILHRDLKGANLLVDSTGHHLRIGDFGTAARLVSQKTVSGEFQGQMLGTIAFMAPEVLRGDYYGRSCDMWSVGCCLIEMASTKPPWKENCMSNHLALMYKIASSKDPPLIPDTLSLGLKNMAVKCLQLNSELRPTAKELLQHGCFIGWQT